MSPLTDLRAAVGMFTILPGGVLRDVDGAIARRLMLSLPWVGAVCGALSAAAAAVVLLCGGGGGLAAVVGLVALAAATGAMHLDGVADTADGLGSRKEPPEALAIMRRSDIGPMGVATLVLVLLLQVSSLAAVEGWRLVPVLLALPVVGRVPVVHATVRGVPGARRSGFGALFTGVTTPRGAVLTTAAVLVVVGATGCFAGGFVMAGTLAGCAVLSWLLAAGWQRHLLRRLGGLTGDTFGSLIEAAQTAFVLAAALAL